MTINRNNSAKRKRSLALLLMLMLLAACDSGAATPGPSPSPNPSSPPTGTTLAVVATTTQIRSMAEAVGGSAVSVHSILPPGADPHAYEPKPSDVQAVSRSAIVLKNGLGLDDWLDKMLGNAGGQRPIVTVTADIPLRKGDPQEPAGDPHVWFNVTNAMTMTRNIEAAFISVDPARTDIYRANTDAYLAKLASLDKYILDQIATLPSSDRKMVTNHDAFGYYIDRYGLTFVGSIIPSMSTESAPSAQDIAELTTKIKEQKVKAIFVESSVNPQLAQQIASDAGVKVVDTLYGDSLGSAGTPGATYEGMMRYNTDTIVSALK